MTGKEVKITYFYDDYNRYHWQHGGRLPGPQGGDVRKEAAALFHYAVNARRMWEEQQKFVYLFFNADGTVKPEMQKDKDDHDRQYNYEKVLLSIAEQYSTKPEKMIKWWRHVDAQFDQIGIPKVPEEDRYRFDGVIEIKTQTEH